MNKHLFTQMHHFLQSRQRLHYDLELLKISHVSMLHVAGFRCGLRICQVTSLWALTKITLLSEHALSCYFSENF